MVTATCLGQQYWISYLIWYSHFSPKDWLTEKHLWALAMYLLLTTAKDIGCDYEEFGVLNLMIFHNEPEAPIARSPCGGLSQNATTIITKLGWSEALKTSNISQPPVYLFVVWSHPQWRWQKNNYTSWVCVPLHLLWVEKINQLALFRTFHPGWK